MPASPSSNGWWAAGRWISIFFKPCAHWSGRRRKASPHPHHRSHPSHDIGGNRFSRRRATLLQSGGPAARDALLACQQAQSSDRRVRVARPAPAHLPQASFLRLPTCGGHFGAPRFVNAKKVLRLIQSSRAAQGALPEATCGAANGRSRPPQSGARPGTIGPRSNLGR